MRSERYAGRTRYIPYHPMVAITSSFIGGASYLPRPNLESILRELANRHRDERDRAVRDWMKDRS